MNRFTRSMLAMAVAGGLSIPVIGVVYGGDRPSAVRMDDKEHQHPHMHNALIHLRGAREELNQSDHIFGKHRDEAIDQTDKAIKLVEDAWNATGGKDMAQLPDAARLDEPARVHGHMHKALAELHESYKELDDVEVEFERGKRMEAIGHVEKAIHECREGLNEAEK